jgi:hypothetical protein
MTDIAQADDMEMDDVSEGSDTWTVTKKTAELSQLMRNFILSKHQAIYDDELDMGDGTHLSMRSIFDLRGADVPTHLPKFIQDASRRECVLGLQHPDPNLDPDGMSPDDELQENPAPVFVGASIKPRESGPQKRDKDGDVKGKGKKPQKKGGAAEASTPAAPKDCVKVAFHLDSQTPHIEIMTRKLGEAAGKSDLLRLCLFASDFELNYEHGLYMQVVPAPGRSIPQFDEDLSSSTGGNVAVSELNDMNEAKTLIQISLALRPQHCEWSGLPAMDVDDIRARTRQQSIKDKTLTRHLTVQHLDRTQFLHLLFPLYNDDVRTLPYLSGHNLLVVGHNLLVVVPLR